MRGSKYFLTAAILCLCVRNAAAQFTTVIDVPPQIAPAGIGSSTQLNLANGGMLPAAFAAGLPDGTSSLVEVNIDGGFTGSGLRANGGSVINIRAGEFESGPNSAIRAASGSTVNITGGRVVALLAESGSTVNLAGGIFRGSLSANTGSTVHISGGDFRVNGELVTGLDNIGDSKPVQFFSNTLLTGTLADGSPFVLLQNEGDNIFPGTLTLSRATLPSTSPNPIVVPTDVAPAGIRSGELLQLNTGGSLASSFVAGWGSTVEIAGGNAGNGFQAVGANVSMSAGSIGPSSRIYKGTMMEVTGGSIGDAFTVRDGATLHVSGGRVGIMTVESGGQLEISGGAGFDSLTLESFSSGALRIVGNEFRLNGVPLNNPALQSIGGMASIQIPSGSLTGVLEDGTPFTFGYSGSNAPITVEAAALPAIGPSLIFAATDPVPLGIRPGQTLVVEQGADVGDFFQAGRESKVIVSGGQLGRGFDAVAAEVEFTGGVIGSMSTASQGTVFNMSGGTILAPPSNFLGTTTFTIATGSVANISGGLIDGRVAVGGEMNLAGGEIDGSLRAGNGSEINLFGIDFVLDGVPLTPSLLQNQPRVVSERGVTLSGTLADGSPFSFDLNPNSNSASDVFPAQALLSIALVNPGDYNVDGIVDSADYSLWRDSLGQQVVRGSGADGNFDGYVTPADYDVWKNNFGSLLGSAGGSSNAASLVPEPSSSILILIALASLPCARHRAASLHRQPLRFS